MAEELGQNRTEQPTPRRREEARKKGQFAFSPELVTAVVVFIGVAFLLITGSSTGNALLEIFRDSLAHPLRSDLDVATAHSVSRKLYVDFLKVAGILLTVLVAAAVGVCVIQVGFRIIPDRLGPDFDKLSPALGLQRLFSGQSVQRLFLALAKAILLVAVAAIVLRGRSGLIQAMIRGSLTDAVGISSAICIRLLIGLSATLLVLGVIDYFVQWRRFEAGLRMTRQEVKEEIKREEGDPLIRARIRQLQQEIVRQRIRRSVPTATVVVTNPTHYAVALRYERNSLRAPVVVAKGAGVVAQQIVEIARRHAVPVLRRPETARAIFATVKEGQEIPTELFQAVAEIIAFVFRLRGVS